MQVFMKLKIKYIFNYKLKNVGILKDKVLGAQFRYDYKNQNIQRVGKIIKPSCVPKTGDASYRFNLIPAKYTFFGTRLQCAASKYLFHLICHYYLNCSHSLTQYRTRYYACALFVAVTLQLLLLPPGARKPQLFQYVLYTTDNNNNRCR